MDGALVLTIAIVIVALAFDFINGFHDAANSIATVVATRVLSPFKAVLWAACFNFAALFVFDTGVAKTVGSGMVDLNFVTPYVILAGLLGAIAWDLLTWWWKLPSSSSHALIGGYAGSAMANAAAVGGIGQSLDVIIASGWTKTLMFIVLAPTIGMLLAHILMLAVVWLFHRVGRRFAGKLFGKLQLLSSALLSLSHGGNDAQKTAGIIAGALFASGYMTEFHIPYWVLICAYSAIALGTAAGGWRIVHTMGTRLTRLQPHSGFCAETAAALSIMLATSLKLPISTTHTITGAIVGVGSMQRVKAVRWGVAVNILWAWILTIPMAGLIGWLSMWAIHFFL
ncbi:MAG: inorganic phosphate transporter [Alphaproteobacteria bacterium]|nr:inorganic phosphate transporter [Alphaproteobacteria bacterium]